MRNEQAQVQTERALEMTTKQAVSARLAKTAFLSRTCERDTLLELGARLGQGYLLGRPEVIG